MGVIVNVFTNNELMVLKGGIVQNYYTLLEFKLISRRLCRFDHYFNKKENKH